MWRSIAASICRCCAFSPRRDGAAIAAARPSTRAVLILGMVQAGQLFTGWPDARPLAGALSGYLGPGARYLVEVPEVPIYYLMGRPGAQPRQFTSTFVIAYTDSRGQTLTGTPGFVAAIAHVLQNSRSYRLAKIALFQGAFAHAPYYIWVKR
jgi:hypothetical protein